MTVWVFVVSTFLAVGDQFAAGSGFVSQADLASVSTGPSITFYGKRGALVERFTGTFTGPLELPDGTVIEPTGKSFEVVFSTIARWQDGKIVEEHLKYDNSLFLQQIGLA